MALTQVTGPYPIFTDLDGTPLDDGYLYIGEINEDPQTNPIQVYWDSALTIVETQPIRTSNGYAYRNGSPALLYTAGEFSITIRNKRQEFVLYSPLGYGFDPAAVSGSVVKNDFVGNGSTVNFTLSATPSTVLATNVFINGVYQEKDSYSLLGNVVTFSIAPPLNSSIEIMTNETGVINSGNANNISYTASLAGAAAQTVQTKLEQYVSVKDFGAVGNGVADDTAEIQAALTATANGSLYFPEGNYLVTSALTAGSVNIVCGGLVTITYNGASHINRVLDMNLAGAPASISGQLIVDGNNKANIGVFIINDNATRVPLTLGDIEGRNCRMVVGSAFNAGSAGVVIRGNFTTVSFDRLWAKNIGRAANTGSIGNYGTNGVIIDRDGSSRAALIVSGAIAGAENITCDDTPGSAGAVDVDGVAVFQNDESGAACQIGFVSSVDTEGRALKAQTYRSTHINEVSVVRSVSGTTGGNADVNLQFADGVIDSCEIVYSGNADTVHGQGTTCVSYYTDASRTNGYGVNPIRNLTVRDNCTSGTATINFITEQTVAAVNATDKFASVENVILLGRPAKALCHIGPNGSSGYGRFILKIDGFVGELTNGLIANNAACPNLFAGVSRVWNTGTTVPAIYRTDAVALGNIFGRIIDNGGNIGVLRYRGTGGLPGLVDDGVNGFTSASIAAGLSPLISGDFVQNVTTQTDKFGVSPGRGLLIMGSPDYGPPGIYTTNGNTITTVQAASGLTVGSGGTDPGGADFNAWKTDSGTRLSIKNANATTRPFFVLVIG